MEGRPRTDPEQDRVLALRSKVVVNVKGLNLISTKFKRLAFYFDNKLFLKRTKLSEASSLTILSFSVDSSELFYLIFILYLECLVRSQPYSSPLSRVPPLQCSTWLLGKGTVQKRILGNRSRC